MGNLNEIIGGIFEDQQHLKKQFLSKNLGVVERFEFYKEVVKLKDSDLKIYERSIGSSFILGHSINGVLGNV